MSSICPLVNSKVKFDIFNFNTLKNWFESGITFYASVNYGLEESSSYLKIFHTNADKLFNVDGINVVKDLNY